MHCSTVLVALCASVVAAQTAAQFAAEIPSCVVQDPCDSAAIASVGCGATDYACHCAHAAQLQSIVLPCLQKSSNCTTGELQTFGMLAQEICTHLNVTTNITTTLPITPTSTSTGTVVPFTGDGSFVNLNEGVFAAIGVALFASIL